MEVDKEEKKAAQPLEKRQEESAQSSTAQSSTAQSSSAAKQEQIAAASASEAEPDPEHSWEEKKSKRKKQQEKKEAREQQKEPASYLEVVVKGGPLQKGQNQPKKKGKLDGKQQYVSLGTSSSSSSLAQPPTPPKPSRLRGTPAQPEREGLPERQPPTPPPPKPLKKRLALDWHNCFQIREKGEDVVPNSHIRAYWDLQAPPQLCWQGKGGGSAAVGQKLAHQMGRHEDSDPQNRVLGQGRMGLALQMHPCAG